MKDIERDMNHRDRIIARNEALRQRIGDIRVSTWAVVLAVIAGAFFVWMAVFA